MNHKSCFSFSFSYIILHFVAANICVVETSVVAVVFSIYQVVEMRRTKSTAAHKRSRN